MERNFEIEKNELLWNLKQSLIDIWYPNVYIQTQIQFLIHAIEVNQISLDNRNIRKEIKSEFKQRVKKNINKHKSDRREKYIEYLSSAEWRNFRKQIIEERGRACQECGSDDTLQVHHKHYLNIYNEQRGDVLLLCYKCHKRLHSMKPKNRKKFEHGIETKKAIA